MRKQAIGRLIYQGGRLVLAAGVVASGVAFLVIAATFAFAEQHLSTAYAALIWSGSAVGVAGGLIFVGGRLGGDR